MGASATALLGPNKDAKAARTDAEAAALSFDDMRDKLEAKDPWRAGKFKPGDYLQVEHRSAHGEPVDAVVGMLIGIHRRGLGSSIRLLCHVDGSAVEYQFQLYSPMVTNITVRRPSDRWNRQKKLYQLRKLVHTLSIPAPLRSGESKSDERKAGAGKRKKRR